MNRASLIWLSTLAVVLGACGSKPEARGDAAQAFKVALKGATEGESPLSGVIFSVDDRPLGATDTAGVLTTEFNGSAGQVVELRGTCPQGYETSEALVTLRLAHTRPLSGSAGAEEPLSAKITCTRKLSEVAVVVHAEGGSGLPVIVDGVARATTDEAGNAHVLLALDRTVPSVRVGIDTTSNASLMPQHPSRTFELHGKDAVLIFDQTLTARARPRVAAPAARKPASRHIPQRLH